MEYAWIALAVFGMLVGFALIVHGFNFNFFTINVHKHYHGETKKDRKP